MALILNEEQAMLRDSARGLIGSKAPVAHLRKLRDERDATGFSRELWRAFAEMGLCGLLVAEQHGGSGLGAVEAGVVMEEIGRNLMPSPFFSTAVLGATALARGGSAAQQQAYLPRLARGDLIAALAVDEGTKHRPLHTAMKATRAGNGFRLSGAKGFVVDGHVADVLVVAARTAGAPGEAAGLTLFVVDARAKGIDIERTVMVDAHNAARVTFNDVEIDADGVLGEVDNGAGLLEAVLNVGRGAVAAEILGVADEAFTRTVGYLKERKQFGKALAEFQGIQFQVAQAATELEAARLMVYNAARLKDAGQDIAREGAMAKLYASQMCERVTSLCVELFGGYGYTREYPVEKYYRDAKIGTIYEGTSNMQLQTIAKAVLR